MFFKRISDVYLEEYDQALDESGADHEFAAFAENHRFAIPEGSLWSDVRNHTQNIGTALQTAFREIEKANPETLYSIFGNATWSNKDKLPDRKLADLIEHFSTRTTSTRGARRRPGGLRRRGARRLPENHRFAIPHESDRPCGRLCTCSSRSATTTYTRRPSATSGSTAEVLMIPSNA
jgi:hypothetical protein